MTAIVSRRRKGPGRLRVSLWHHGIWMARLSAALSVLVIACGFADLKLLRVPAIAFVASGAGGLGVLGLFFCLWGLKRDSRRWRMASFWFSLAGCFVVLAVLGVLYGRMARTSPDPSVGAVIQSQ